MSDAIFTEAHRRFSDLVVERVFAQAPALEIIGFGPLPRRAGMLIQHASGWFAFKDDARGPGAPWEFGRTS